MADSRRQDLVDAILARFRLITPLAGYQTNLGQHVAVWRDTTAAPFAEAELPALNLRDPKNDIEQILTNKHEHSITIIAEGFVSSGAVDADVRKCLADLYKAVGVDRKWGGLAVDTLPKGDEFTVRQNGTAIAGFVLTLIVKLRTANYDPYHRMKVIYLGPLPQIEIDHGGTTQRVKPGETIDVPEKLGEELCARKEFKRAEDHPASRNPQPASPKST